MCLSHLIGMAWLNSFKEYLYKKSFFLFKYYTWKIIKKCSYHTIINIIFIKIKLIFSYYKSHPISNTLQISNFISIFEKTEIRV